MTKTTKRAMLSSVLALFLCFAMFIGTTFAWFTDSVTSSNNIIKSGTLKIEFEYWNGTAWNTVDGASDILAYDLWEPGFADVAYLRLKNAGTLALKYQLGVNVVSETEGVNKAGNPFKLSDYIYFDVKEGVNGETAPFADREAAMAIATETTKISDGYTKADSLAAGSGYTYLALVVYMPITVDNVANHDGVTIPQINLGLNILATQMEAEEDSFGPDYDADAKFDMFVTDEASLKNALATGGDYILTADIAVADVKLTVANGVNVTLDMNGKTISGTYNGTENQEMFLVKGNLSVKNGSFDLVATNNQGWGAMATIFDVTAGGALDMTNVTASVGGTDMNFIVHLNNWGTATLNVNDCDFTTSYVAVRAFNSGYDMNNVTIKNSDFHGGRMFWVHNYTAEGCGDATLNLDIYGNGNTSDHSTPVRFGFDNEVYFDLNGNAIQ